MIQLADLGHNVYIGNNRGNEYSQGHVAADDFITLFPDSYWDFSWHDMHKDVLANVEAMYRDSDNTKGIYIGYSQGTIQATVALVEREDTLLQYL